MATKLAKPGHTAGIFADMTVDGPEMGTLVVVVDRARHLPNRKTVGKQDPYCAARLGKEAKKTTTDKRGGQTPRWDQELRFTVYDSPDYHKLKISLFNDDKKCELIGEAWILLSEIFSAGGGQSDKWHPLTWRGKYAGEIQLELTFWDMRPREDPPKPAASAPRAAPKNEATQEQVSGPRSLPRRPLPVEPGAPAAQPTAPAPVLRAQSEQPQAPPPQSLSFGPRDPNAEATQMQPAAGRHSFGGHEAHYDYGYEQRPPQEFTSAYDLPEHPHDAEPQELYLHDEPAQAFVEDEQLYHDEYAPSEQGYHGYDAAHPDVQFALPSNELQLPELPPLAPRAPRQAPQQQPKQYYASTDRNAVSEYTLPHYRTPAPARSAEPLRPVSRGTEAPSHYQGRRGPRRSFGEQPHLDALQQYQPPPPPSHRNRGFAGGHPALVHSYTDPAYLEQSVGRQQLTAEALDDAGFDDDEPYLANPATETQLSSRSAPLPDGYRDPRAHRRHSAYDQEPDMYEPEMPAPLTMGDRGHAPRVRFDDRRSVIGSGAPPRDPYQTPPRRVAPSVRHQASSVFEPSGPPSSRGPPPSEPAVHRSSVPIVKPQPLTPDHHNSIPRKSVSPAVPPEEREGLGGMAFSPDSFDVLNPNLRAARSINDPAPKYDNPESLREAAHERLKEEELLSRGPIVDAAGNVIDPTDHLPSDTWAPEPEKKAPRKTHEVKLRFRHHHHSSAPPPTQRAPPPQHRATPPRDSPYEHPPQAAYAQHASSPARRPYESPRPHPAHAPQPRHYSSPAAAPPPQPQPMHAYPADDASPGRNRLQKRQPQGSSPAQTPPGGYQRRPDSYHTPPPPPRGYTGGSPQGAPAYHRHSQGYGSPSPLREVRNPNVRHGDYAQRSSPLAAPPQHQHHQMAPPVPAKVPHGREQEDWGPGPDRWGAGVDRLSMEIGAIDIGSGGGRARRAR